MGLCDRKIKTHGGAVDDCLLCTNGLEKIAAMSQIHDPRDPRYAAVGVDSKKAEDGLSRLRTWVEKTFTLNPAAHPHLPLGYFAFIRLDGLNTGIAISTDGVGTKLLVADSWANTIPWASTLY
jgi:hypothetical protein